MINLELFATAATAARLQREVVLMMKGELPWIMLHNSQSTTVSEVVSTESLNPILLDIPGAQQFPHYTIFDILGWCIARSAGAIPADVTDETYVSLLTVFSKWCCMTGTGAMAPDTVSVVSYGGSFVLSASLQDSSVSRAVQRARRTHLEGLHISGFPSSMPFGSLVKFSLGDRAVPVLQDFGSCAESHSFMALCMS